MISSGSENMAVRFVGGLVVRLWSGGKYSVKSDVMGESFSDLG